MLGERLKWLGTLIVTEVGIWLAWKQVATALPLWTQWVAVGVVALGFLLYYPYSRDTTGSVQRLINFRQHGRGNVATAPGNNSPVTGNITNTGSGTQTVYNTGLQLTMAEVRQASLDASRAEVLPAARAVASQTAVAVVDERIGVLSDKVLEHINERNPDLFARWDDPRFLAALTSAQSSYAETGDEDLGETLASLVAGMASKPIRSMHEIVLRQAIEIAPHLTSAHLKAIAVNLLLTRLSYDDVFDTDMLITALDLQFRPYYGELPSSQFDYTYMSSTGVGYYTEGLQELGNKPHQLLHRRFLNAMYASFTFAEMTDTVLSDIENHRLLAVIPARRDDIIPAEGVSGSRVQNIQNAAFRVAADCAPRILSNAQADENALTEPERQLQSMVRARFLSADEFRDRIVALKPALGEFLASLEQSGATNFQLHPVGMILARHEMAGRAPRLATLIDAAFDEI